MSKKINFGFRATPERQEELKILAAKRRQSVQAMIEEALRLLESAPGAATPTHQDSKWHKIVDAILANPLERTALEEHLEAAVQRGTPGDAEERRLIEEYRRSSLEKRRRMLAFVAKQEDALGPERMPQHKRK